MANKVLHKKSAVENKAPLPASLDYGELAINLHDGNIYLKKSDDTIAEMKRLDERLNSTDVTNMVYNVDGDLSEVHYSTGNKTILNYNAGGDLASVDYYATDSTTHIYTQTLNYDINANLINTSWSEV